MTKNVGGDNSEILATCYDFALGSPRRMIFILREVRREGIVDLFSLTRTKRAQHKGGKQARSR